MNTATLARLALVGMSALWTASTVLAQSAIPPAPAAEPARLPTMADLQAMHDAAEYRTCLQQIARVLALSGEAAKPYDRYALLLLRGDCLLHLKDSITALDAYTAAEQSPEPAQKAEARATALLIRASAGLNFTPKTPPGGSPIDIADPRLRKAAMLDLMQQELSDSKPAIDAAETATTLVPIFDAAPMLIDLHALEYTATGADRQTHGLRASVAEHARDLMSNELTIVNQRIADIEKAANRPIGVTTGGLWWNALARQGLTTDTRESLRHDADYVDKIKATAGHCQRIARSLGSPGQKWEPIIEEATRTAQHARDVLLAE